MIQKRTKKDDKILEIGKSVLLISEAVRLPKKPLLWNAFIKGLAQGFGAVLGGTVLVALLLWVLSFFDQVPILGRFISVLGESINK